MDGTENQADTLQGTGQPSPEAQETSPKDAKTYTEEEFNKRVSDALAKAGRDAKALADQKASIEAQQQEIEATKAEIAEMQKRIDEAELEAARGDPSKLREYQAKKSYKDRIATLDAREKDLKKQQAAFARDKAEHTEKVRAAEEVTLGIKLYEIAARHELNPEDLKAGVKDLNLTTVEQAESLAKRMGQRPPETKGETTTPVSVPTTGGTRSPTQEQREKMPMEDYAALRKKEDPNLI